MKEKWLVAEFGNDHPELHDLASFSKPAREVLFGVSAANRGDPGTVRFAVRAARALTIYDEGVHRRNRPIFAALLYGPRNGPQRELALALAEQYIGKPVNGMPALHTIDCAEYPPGTNPLALTRLIGPRMPNSPTPSLWSDICDEADKLSRTGPDVLPLRNIIRWFLEEVQKAFNELQPFVARFTERGETIAKDSFEKLIAEANTLLKEIQGAETQIIEAHTPYRSVILFDGVEFGSPELLGSIIRPILKTGFLSEEATFHNSIILLTMYDPLDAFTHGDIGFAPSPRGKAKQTSLERYLQIRRALQKNPSFRGIVHDIGEQLIIVGPKSEKSQEHLCKRRLAEIRMAMRKLAVRVEFSAELKAVLVKRSASPETQEFSTERLDELIDHYVRLPLAQTIAQGELSAGKTMKFELKEDGMATLPHISDLPGGNAPITRKEAADAFEALLRIDELADTELTKSLQGKAVALLTKAYSLKNVLQTLLAQPLPQPPDVPHENSPQSPDAPDVSGAADAEHDTPEPTE